MATKKTAKKTVKKARKPYDMSNRQSVPDVSALALGALAVVEETAKKERAKAGRKAPRKACVKKTDGLTLQQHRFIEGMLIQPTARQAALYAGYSEGAASVMANLNMQKPVILKELARRRAEVAKYVNITAHDILNELEHNRVAALEAPTPQIGAAVAATMGKAKILGFLVDRVDHTSKGEQVQAGMGHFYGEIETSNSLKDVTPSADDDAQMYPDED